MLSITSIYVDCKVVFQIGSESRSSYSDNYSRPRHFEFRLLQIGTYQFVASGDDPSNERLSRLKIIFTTQKFVYEYELPSRIPYAHEGQVLVTRMISVEVGSALLRFYPLFFFLTFSVGLSRLGSIFHGGGTGLQRYGGADAGGHEAVRLHRLPDSLSGPVALLRLRADGRRWFHARRTVDQSAASPGPHPPGSGQQTEISSEQFQQSFRQFVAVAVSGGQPHSALAAQTADHLHHSQRANFLLLALFIATSWRVHQEP